MAKTPEEIAIEEAATKAAEEAAEAAKKAEEADDEKLREGGLKALKAERAAREAAEKRIAEFEKAAKDAADAEKTDLEKLTEANSGLTGDLTAAQQKLVRLEIALEKGLTSAQMRRLVGDTKEELEADAEALIEELGGSSTKQDPRTRTRELRGGSNPGSNDKLEMDPDKLAALIQAKRQ